MIATLGVITAVVIGIVLYIYTALVLYTIAKKLKKDYAWIAWIPIANMFYVPVVAGYAWYYGFLNLLTIIPFIGMLAVLGINIWWWWRISEERKFPGWFSLFMLLPPVWLIIMGVIAWGKAK